jgi:6-phosphogluconate dehydrogenase
MLYLGSKMKIAMIGLGKMGGNMVLRCIQRGHSCVVFDANPASVEALAKDNAKDREGVIPARSLEDLKAKLGSPAVVWLMLPSGQVTDQMIEKISGVLSAGSIVVDGGNAYFKDDVRHAKALSRRNIRYLDVGVSGGVWGLERGYSLMIGGDADAARQLEPIFEALAPGIQSAAVTEGRSIGGRDATRTADRGYLYCGPTGSGHFVKMVHNGIEYGMMQALAEGFDILKGAASDEIAEEFRYALDLREVSEVWRRGSVVSSWLLDLIAVALNADPQLSRFEGHVPDSGEGRWTVQAALEEGIPATVLSAALYARFRSREARSFADQMLSAMRFGFGGHAESPKSSSNAHDHMRAS